MNLGFTFDEKILKIKHYKQVFDDVKLYNIHSIELSPDLKIMSFKEYDDITSYATEKNIKTNFHIPYFADNLYNCCNLDYNKKNILKKYEEFIKLISNLTLPSDYNPIITIHGTNYNDFNNKKSAFNSTIYIIDWLLNFIKKNNFNCKLAIETLNKESIRRIGDNRDELLNIVKYFKSDNLGICWDVTHESFNYYPNEIPIEKEFLEHVIYCHLHGISINNRVSHIALKNSEINFNHIIKYLNDINFTKIINLELLINYCGDSYYSDLINDIHYLTNLFEK